MQSALISLAWVGSNVATVYCHTGDKASKHLGSNLTFPLLCIPTYITCSNTTDALLLQKPACKVRKSLAILARKIRPVLRLESSLAVRE